jgi:outer membrane protein TolC
VDDTVFEIPQDISLNGSINEKLSSINKLNLQKQNILNADKLQASETLPKANLFAQAGYGRPGLNFLENDFSTYYIAGVNLKWNLSSFYNNSRNEEINSLKSQKVNALIENQRKLIETNIDQYKSQLKSVSTQMESDELIIKMAIDIKENAQYQLEQGALDMSEYIQKLNIEKEAFVNKSIHEIHEIKLKYIINHLSGNLK